MSSHADNVQGLLENIRKRNLRLAVLGSGYVGLPTSALFAEAGFNVTAVDVKREIVEVVNRGLSPINEPELSELVKTNVEAGRLKASLVSEVDWGNIDAIIISVPTPIYRNKRP
jgi:UDP-N-acetyl-D-mannosaminuronic acid dehydrogenase